MRWVSGLRMARFVSRSLRVGEVGRAAECLGYIASDLQPNRGETYMSRYLNHSTYGCSPHRRPGAVAESSRPPPTRHFNMSLGTTSPQNAG